MERDGFQKFNRDEEKYITLSIWCLMNYELNYRDKWGYMNWNWIFKYAFEVFIIDFLEMEIARREFDFGSFYIRCKRKFLLTSLVSNQLVVTNSVTTFALLREN